MRWIQDPKTLKLVPASEYHPEEKVQVFVRGDHPDFVSPVDGTVVGGRRSLREHNKRNGVVNLDEFGSGHFERAATKRAAYYEGRDPEIRRQWRKDLDKTMREVNIHE